MFASVFRNKSASTIRRASLRVRLGVETLEDRTVPSTLLSNLGAAGDGVHLFAGSHGTGVEGKTEQVSVPPGCVTHLDGGVNLLGRAGGTGVEV